MVYTKTMSKGEGNMIEKIKVFIKKYWIGYLLLMPFVILFIIFIILPVIVAFGISFTNYNMIESPKWAGITNYKLLLMDDKIFLKAIANTMIFALITGPIGYILSFIAAWVINQLRLRNVFALAFYAPSLTQGAAMSSVWLIFFSSDRYGHINNLLTKLGIINQPIAWNLDPQYILKVVMLIAVWMSMGTGFLVFLAGLQNISREYYEAGSLDGIKNKFQELYYLTLPLMKPQLLFGAINSIVGSFGVFDIAVSFAGIPSPNYAAHTIVSHLFDYAFIRFQMGYASSIAMVLFIITFFSGRIVMRLLRTKDV